MYMFASKTDLNVQTVSATVEIWLDLVWLGPGTNAHRPSIPQT